MSRHRRAEDHPEQSDQPWLAAAQTGELRRGRHASATEPEEAAEEYPILVARAGTAPAAPPSGRHHVVQSADAVPLVAQTPEPLIAEQAVDSETVLVTGVDPQQVGQVPAEPVRRRRTPLGGRLRKPVLAGAAALTCLLLVGAGTTAAMAKKVTIVVDGQTQQVTTLAGTVDGALSSAGLIVGDHDTLAPAANSGIADGATIVLDHGRPLELTIDGTKREIWTTARTVDEALQQMGLADGGQLRLSADRSRPIPLNGLAVTASTKVQVTMAVGGGKSQTAESSATTVGALLAERGITLGPLDTVSPAPATTLTDGLRITVNRVTQNVVTESRTVPQPAEQKVQDAGLEQGQTAVVQPGNPGTTTVTLLITAVNGVETGRVQTGSKVAVSAKPRIVKVGTKTPDPAGPVAAAAAEKKFTYVGSQVFTNDRTFGVNWDGLAFCESTHNPKAVNANPSAGLPTYGMFQFDIPTWESVGGSGNPMDASPSEQLMRAKMLYQQRGLEPWACRDSAH